MFAWMTGRWRDKDKDYCWEEDRSGGNVSRGQQGPLKGEGGGALINAGRKPGSIGTGKGLGN